MLVQHGKKGRSEHSDFSGAPLPPCLSSWDKSPPCSRSLLGFLPPQHKPHCGAGRMTANCCSVSSLCDSVTQSPAPKSQWLTRPPIFLTHEPAVLLQDTCGIQVYSLGPSEVTQGLLPPGGQQKHKTAETWTCPSLELRDASFHVPLAQAGPVVGSAGNPPSSQ